MFKKKKKKIRRKEYSTGNWIILSEAEFCLTGIWPKSVPVPMRWRINNRPHFLSLIILGWTGAVWHQGALVYAMLEQKNGLPLIEGTRLLKTCLMQGQPASLYLLLSLTSRRDQNRSSVKPGSLSLTMQRNRGTVPWEELALSKCVLFKKASPLFSKWKRLRY